MNAVDFVAGFGIFSREGKCKPASKSEARRWIEAEAVQVNGERMEIEEIDFPVFSLTIFPKGRKVTLK